MKVVRERRGEGPNDTMQVQTTRRVRSFVNSTTVGHVHIVTVVVN